MKKTSKWITSIALTTCMVIFSSCQTLNSSQSNSKENRITPPDGIELAPVQQMTFKGINANAIYSATGRQIIFISSHRRKHEHKQVYRMQLASRRQARITYHDGENFKVFRAKDSNHIYYTSTTDEIKENSTYLDKVKARIENTPEKPKAATSQLPMTEIYRSRLDGSEIKRITHSPKFDGDISVHPTSGKLVFASNRLGSVQLFVMPRTYRKTKRFTRRSPTAREPKFSVNGKDLVWIEYNPKTEKTALVLSKHNGRAKTTIFESSKNIKDPVWTINSDFIIFSSNHQTDKNYELYAIDKKGTCLKRITYHLAHDSAPDISPDGKSILFTSDRKGDLQIYTRPFSLPGSCIKVQQ